ncbi:inter-alpha-trypsin inhibitor heavy chain H2 [Ambystoma mexicanum]|uniref:inter-alpha-trypsin inhibitor heavy chain H2 n=1 Tax=Ambystoma mexicanum TaxID=8296 RepID=UPI0037E81BED
MRRFLCLVSLLLVSGVQGFDILIDDIPEALDHKDILLEGIEFSELHRNGRYKRSDISSEEDGEEVDTGDEVTLQSYRVDSRITSHFVNTRIRSKVVNNAKRTKTVEFDIKIPKGAFINNFTMNVNGITFSGSIKEKSVARSLFSQARAKGKAAGLVRTNAMDMENFKADLSVPPGSKVQFEINYQETLRRKLGIYEHIIHLEPGKLAKKFQVDVHISEPQGLRLVSVPDSLGDHFAGLVNITKEDKRAHISFKPTVDQQRKCPNCPKTAVDGNFIVKYDTKRDSSSELQLFNGYFLHFFAPENLSPLPKNILFVIDVSGSMWGLKMRQTVQAMQTILDDLRSDDQFSVIDFNHNVRCWREELVEASSIQTEDAKQYIRDIQPGGGTNINEALLRAIFILKEAHSRGMLEPNSISLIVLVSDGDPTVGELKLSKIQKNVKKEMRDDFSLHALGIGFDVDYDFLERIAQENHGMAQRIYGNQDTSKQLKEFYNQVSTPLLKNIEFIYPHESVSDVTQNSFNTFYGGDEIVVAGKVGPQSAQVLQSIVQATAANANLIVDTLAEAEEMDQFLKESKYAFPDFAKQYWAHLTINQLLAERNLAPSAALKRNITRTILQLSVEHHLVTPLTAMLIENADGDERMLADSPRDPKRGCCPSSVVVGTKIPPPTFVPVARSSPPPEAKKGPTSIIPIDDPSETASDPTPTDSSPTDPIAVKLVDGDPHFIIHLPESQTFVCFNIDSQPGRILNLISDPELGVVVNGQLVGSKMFKNNKLSTYLGTVGLHFRKENMKIEISTEKITLKYATQFIVMSWEENSRVTQNSFTVSVLKNKKVTITLNEELSFTLLLHRVWKKHPVNVDYLGVYIPPTNQFSPMVHGLLGQFMHEPKVRIYNVRPGSKPEKPEASMDVKGHTLTVTSGVQKDIRTDGAAGTDVRCWFVHNSGKGFIDGHYKDYLVPHLYSSLKRP